MTARTSTDRSLRPLLAPRSVAIVGATERPGSVGATVMRNVIDGGFPGPVTPVNPGRASVFDRVAVARVEDLPQPPDLAVLCTPAHTVPALLRACGKTGIRGAVVLAAGFRESGPAGRALEQDLRDALAETPSLRVLGPNCLGLIVPGIRLNASFARAPIRGGTIALCSQSGALCSAMLGWADAQGIGFSHFLSVGNMTDVGFADLLDALAEDDAARSVVLYIEALTDARRFVASARRCTARKPVVVFKAGRHAAAARAAASHTGAMAGEDAVYDAAFEHAGIVRVDRLDAFLATAELLAGSRWPRGRRLGIVTNAGGPGVIATDALVEGGGTLATLSESTIAALDAVLPACWSHGNPVDVIGDADHERLASATRHVIADPTVDAVLVMLTPQAIIDARAAAEAVGTIAASGSRPVLASWMGGAEVATAVAALRRAGVPAYATPEPAIEAFLHLAKHVERREAEARCTPQRADTPAPDAQVVGAAAGAIRLLQGCAGPVDEPRARRIFGLFDIAMTPADTAGTEEAAVDAARRLGYPVVLKVISPGVTHKTDVGGVALDLRSDDAVRAAFRRIRDTLARRSGTPFSGVSVQPMLDRSAGEELILGARRDTTFGPVVMVGAGGTRAEVLGDRALALAPLDPRDARALCDRLRIRSLLGPWRGRAALDVDAVATMVTRLGWMIDTVPGIAEVEANPVLVTVDGAVALDARLIAHPAPDGERAAGLSDRPVAGTRNVAGAAEA